MIYLSIRNFRKGFVGTGKVRKVMKYKIMEYDDVLKLYEADLDLRVNDYHKKREELIGANGSIVDFANGHEYFGICLLYTSRGHCHRLCTVTYKLLCAITAGWYRD